MPRSAGVLVHISSLPSSFGIGDLGPEAFRFVDFLAESSIGSWQILPLNPTLALMGNSPYSSYSAFAGNYLFISPERLVEMGWCASERIASLAIKNKERVNFEPLYQARQALFEGIFEDHRRSLETNSDYQKFCAEQSGWLLTFAEFVAIKSQFSLQPWTEWPVELRDRHESALEQFRSDHTGRIELEKFIQFLFYQQWFALKSYGNDRGVRIIGDLPIYLSLDSSDLWQNPSLFKLDSNKQPTAVAGVPPDYFSETGQLWGNPVYDWVRLEETGFEFWLNRLEHNFLLFDSFRVDHFRGLVAYWEIAAGEKTAVNGHWEKVPFDSFTAALRKRFATLPVIAEDLGTISDEVKEGMKNLGWPGMRIFQFGFSGDLEGHPYLPHNYIENCVAYGGTHDNNTTLGWFLDDLDDNLRQTVCDYLKVDGESSRIPETVMSLLLASKANLVILSAQDLIGLGSEARFNQPSIAAGNWSWRMLPGQLTDAHASYLKRMIAETNRRPE